MSVQTQEANHSDLSEPISFTIRVFLQYAIYYCKDNVLITD